MEPNQQSPEQTTGQPIAETSTQEVKQVNNPLAAMQPGEEVIFDIKRHPIGILLIYGTLGVLLLAAAFILFGVLPDLAGGNNSGAAGLGTAIFFLLAIMALVFAFVANIVYWGNRWIVTSDSITQISQISLFNKQSSQLSLKNVEDISAHKQGILQHIFNYGSLKAETANERTTFLFTYCPRPTEHAQRIIQAHEALTMAKQPEQPQQH